MITTTIITLNEERDIAGAIENAFLVSSEVLVIDSASTDKTQEIARKCGARVIEQAYLGDGPQKDFGVQFASNDWILSLDADERLDDRMVAAIKSLRLGENAWESVDAFSIFRKNYLGDRYQKCLDGKPVPRLYHRDRARYNHMMMHAGVQAKSTKVLDGAIIHHTYDDYLDLVRKGEFFLKTTSADLIKKGVKVYWWTPILMSKFDFIKRYFLKGGIFDGVDGLTLSIHSAYSCYMRYAYVYEQSRLKREL